MAFDWNKWREKINGPDRQLCWHVIEDEALRKEYYCIGRYRDWDRKSRQYKDRGITK